MTDAQTDYLTTEEVAGIIKSKTTTLAKARCYKTSLTIPYIRVGRRIMYCRADVDAWMMAHRVDPSTGGGE